MPNETPPNRLEPGERYTRDAQFAALVDSLVRAIELLQLTPTEVREAAMLACYKVSMRETRLPEWFGFYPSSGSSSRGPR